MKVKVGDKVVRTFPMLNPPVGEVIEISTNQVFDVKVLWHYRPTWVMSSELRVVS